MGFTYERVINPPSPSPSPPESETLLSQPNPTSKPTLNRITTPLLKALTILLALYGLTTLALTLLHPILHPPPPTTCSCGTSTTTALSLGCKYDSLAAAWLPPHCRDDDLTAEFDRAGPGPNGTWTYYADDYHTIPMSLDEVAMLADNQSARVKMTREWHVVHCLFYWRKMVRVKKGVVVGGMVEPSFDTEEHVRHCVGLCWGRVGGLRRELRW
ncbi:hypothetical protein ASPCADRAFT_130793 [Aspergillus carbonarius ITEM 5010]|uniref:Uncharacterized protein n=1 Tax=Aspergillus carbonarius (strain ITEM 5010) TaxID=602072 RepID=A0A1R3RLE8_ASPC5|nr:hypothetical protein ASPCADRAFT_130793 [Aspergillus carbonarius ITEM 5010]